MQNDAAIFNQAVKAYQERELAEAEKLFRQILMTNPRHAQSLHMMGLIALDVQRYDIAENLVRQALEEQDNNAGFYFTLARVLNRQEKKEAAVENYKKALSIKPDYTDALNNLGTTLMSLGEAKEAATIFKRLLAADPHNFNALCNTASLLYNEQKYEEALEYYNEALKINPASANVHYDIGRALKRLGRFEDALASFKNAVQYKTDYIDALINIADIYRGTNKVDDAIDYYLRVTAIEPHEEAYSNLVGLYAYKNREREAIEIGIKAVSVLPKSTISLNNLGAVYGTVSKFQEALDCYERSLLIDPDNGVTYADMASTLKNLGRLDEAIPMYKKALTLLPETPWIYSNLLLAMIYASFVPPEELAEVSRQFGTNVTDSLLRQRPFTNDKNPDRKLRIGYVSPDFREHAVSYFLAPIYKCDKENFEIFAYSKVDKEDTTTEKIKKYFNHWRDIKNLNDDAAADLIEADQIDILVDPAGHTARNGLMIFARKPAPIQVTWLGYPASTGMKAMDYRITDTYAEPPGMTEHLNTEVLWRLPQIFCAYSPHENSPAVIDHPPFEDNGYITFGCFNNFTKVSNPTLETWAKIMEQVPNSRLLLEIYGVDNEKIRAHVLKRMAQYGIPIERVILESFKRSNQYVLYNKIDIALDPFPCVGGTTSMDTLWMGVPFVTLAGNHFTSRMGVTILNNVGLPELIANNMDEYISIAVDIAQDHDKLRQLRYNLRARTAASPLMDQDAFARNMEQAYRAMWQKWVQQ